MDRVLHNRGRVSQANIEKIQKIVKDFEYTPNRYAQGLRNKNPMRFGVLIPELDSEFGYWKQVKEGIEEAKIELSSFNIEVVYGFFDRNSNNTFGMAVSKLMESGLTALIVAPLLPDCFVDLRARYPEIPFVVIDSPLPDINPLADFAQDPYKAGKTAARMMQLMVPNAQRMFIYGNRGVALNERIRAESFTEEYAEISVSPLVFNDADELVSIIEHSIPCGVFVVNDSSHVIAEKLHSKNIDNCQIIGFDLHQNNKICLEKGYLDVIIGQMPRRQAYEALMFLVRYFILELKERERFSAPVEIYIKENLPKDTYWS